MERNIHLLGGGVNPPYGVESTLPRGRSQLSLGRSQLPMERHI